MISIISQIYGFIKSKLGFVDPGADEDETDPDTDEDNADTNITDMNNILVRAIEYSDSSVLQHLISANVNIDARPIYNLSTSNVDNMMHIINNGFDIHYLSTGFSSNSNQSMPTQCDNCVNSTFTCPFGHRYCVSHVDCPFCMANAIQESESSYVIPTLQLDTTKFTNLTLHEPKDCQICCKNESDFAECNSCHGQFCQDCQSHIVTGVCPFCRA